MKKTLRPYQQDALNELRRHLKESTDPILVNASVGAGKSLVIASLLNIIQRANWRALCLTMNSTLIQQNANTYFSQGGKAGIYCTGLKKKDTKNNIIFGSPHSIAIGIKYNHPISLAKFNLIVVDEAHNINHHNKSSMYMRILNHYRMLAQTEQYSFRVVGLTGTPYRGKSISIIGENEYFKKEICQMSRDNYLRMDMPWLIENHYLVQPIFGKISVDSFDMKNLRVDKMGKFKHKDLQKAVDEKERLTGEIMREIVSIVESGRNGAFIFASTIKHADECMRSLPPYESVIITGDTPHYIRSNMLNDARIGKVKYIVSVSTMLVGVDVPYFDICALLRATESLVIFSQAIGRVLRLHESKQDAIVLDYAQNLERHGDIDDPIINEAVKQKDKDDPEYCIKCYQCNTMNTATCRRCIGTIEKDSKKERCSYYFQFKECKNCGTSNDQVARHCRSCDAELIDPNKKLTHLDGLKTFKVKHAKYWISTHGNTLIPIINIKYTTEEREVFENYYIKSEKAKNMCYGQFIKKHFDNSSEFYPFLTDVKKIQEMISLHTIKTPHYILCKKDNYNRYCIVKKIFNDSIV